MSSQDYENHAWAMMLFATVLLMTDIYYRCHALLGGMGMTWIWLDRIFAELHHSGLLDRETVLKVASLAFLTIGMMMRRGQPTSASWRSIAAVLIPGYALFLIPAGLPAMHLAMSVAGFFLCAYGTSLVRRKTGGLEDPMENEEDTFPQCERKITTPYSINIPTLYRWKGRTRRGWINVVNPFRATMVLGTPGSGKSFSVYNPYIEQMIAKGYSMFVYDYKFPDLTEVVYNELMMNDSGYRVKPKFYVINFNDPTRSHRCNPINPKYITDPSDTSEIAELIMRNINRGESKEDFFTMSAKVYLDALIYFLSIYDPDAEDPERRGRRKGCYCTFPHLIELMGQSYKTIFEIFQDYEEVQVKITTFNDAYKDKAMEQLQGQIASARIPLSKFVSPQLYWVLSGNDFTLDINNPEEPKIVCMGNDPDRQSIYGTTLALFTSRMFKIINHKGKLHSAVLLDEMPTIFLKGIDNLIATARSNKVAIVIGAQDKSQMTRDYSRDEATVIFNTIGTLFSGQVNGETAQELSKTFGQQWRMEKSVSDSDSSQSVSTSYRLQDILPASRIETLSQGTFFGKVADNKGSRIRKKLFCGEIQIDMDAMEEKRKLWKELPVLTDFGTDDPDEIHDVIMENYRSIKKDIEELILSEVARIAAKRNP